MEKEYYSIVKRYNINPFTSGLLTSCFYDLYHGYIFKKDKDGPTLIYDAVYTNTQQAQEDLNQVGCALGLEDIQDLGVFTEDQYKAEMFQIFHDI